MDAHDPIPLLFFFLALAVGVSEVLQTIQSFLVLRRALAVRAYDVTALDEQQVLRILYRGQAMSYDQDGEGVCCRCLR